MGWQNKIEKEDAQATYSRHGIAYGYGVGYGYGDGYGDGYGYGNGW